MFKIISKNNSKKFQKYFKKCQEYFKKNSKYFKIFKKKFKKISKKYFKKATPKILDNHFNGKKSIF